MAAKTKAQRDFERTMAKLGWLQIQLVGWFLVLCVIITLACILFEFLV